MNRIIVCVLGVFAATSALAADVGVSVQISQPGVYGRVDIGRFPQPTVVAAQPVLVAPAPVARPAVVQPVYMWVPPGHQKNWRKHCHQYNACGVPVYFVQEGWYQDHVMVGHKHKAEREGKGQGRGPGRGQGRGKNDD